MLGTSQGFSFDRNDIIHTLKVCGYSVLATIIGSVIVIVGQIHVPAQDLFIVPIVNTLLVALEQFLKDHSK